MRPLMQLESLRGSDLPAEILHVVALVVEVTTDVGAPERAAARVTHLPRR